ncbi:hypothetical protein ABE493_07725 [Stenotrophomonas terrae]|uniref:hypothetical protein n=1 Tax=Stenotrophomonas terrae TaxID=405446 RepID=UPI00320790B7
MQAHQHTALVRDALLEAIDAPAHTLRRSAGTFSAPPRVNRTSGPKRTVSFSKRILLKMCDAGLIKLDDPNVPSSATLTDSGIRAASELKASRSAKAVHP